MRLAYLVAPAVLGLFLVGCGPDEPEEVDPPPAITEQPQLTPDTPAAPNDDTGPLSGDIDEPMTPGDSPAGNGMADPADTGREMEADPDQ